MSMKEGSSITGITVKLIGNDGNAFAILGAVKSAMRRAGVDKKIQDEYMKEAMSGDYDNLLSVISKYVDIE